MIWYNINYSLFTCPASKFTACRTPSWSSISIGHGSSSLSYSWAMWTIDDITCVSIYIVMQASSIYILPWIYILFTIIILFLLSFSHYHLHHQYHQQHYHHHHPHSHLIIVHHKGRSIAISSYTIHTGRNQLHPTYSWSTYGYRARRYQYITCYR